MDYAALATLLLQAWFEIQKQAGKTEAELEALYQEEKAKFYANKPELLPDP